MKPFNDFYSECKEQLDKSALDASKSLSGGPYSPSEIAGKMIVCNQMLILDTLRLYHEWLSEQPEK